jgi:hypothetical protein
MAEDFTYNTALGMCQMMLRQKSEGAKNFFSADEIRSVAKQLLLMPTFAGIDLDRLVRDLETRFTVHAPGHGMLEGSDDHVPWLPGKMGSIRWRYWDRYLLHLTSQLSDAAVGSLDRVATDVLERLEDPERNGEWDRRGLVMGSVQSGKTANYIGLVAKAADAGYKVIIVLTGRHNSLRSQTQLRLDEGFLGFKSQPRLEAGMEAFTPVGVGMLDGSIRANTGTNRTEKGDFSRHIANQFGINPGGLPLLFVVKKDTRVLQNLLSWIRSSADAVDPESNRRYVRNVPLLLIDDEADVASIDTKRQQFDADGKPDLEHDPSITNGLIREILRAFQKVAYVGYTATPFANIYIHDRGYTRELGPDLFPRSFIVNLPPPNNYMGPAQVFGINADEDVGLDEVSQLPIVRVIEDHANSEASDETEGWMPPKLVHKTEHVPLFEGSRQIPPSLREALISFILTIAVRKLRRPAAHHNSMLVHVVRYTNVQRIIAEEIEVALQNILQRLRLGDGERKPTIREELRLIWDSDYIPTSRTCGEILEAPNSVPALPSWSEVESLLIEVTASIKLRIINGTAGDILDYDEHRETGLNLIAVGGDKLARGLTLDGLSISYFLRSSRMYDTLMQMGRWFGYRDGYIDLCRLYATREIIDWFTHIAAASEELRLEFDHMVESGGTPKDYGIKVRSHPVLLVTSAVKMRNGTEMRLTYGGDISETIIFSRDEGWVARNLAATADWIHTLGLPARRFEEGGVLWETTAASVEKFLSAYSTHRDALRAKTSLLIKYIQRMQDFSELTNWSVLLCSSSDATRKENFGDFPIGLIRRAEFPTQQRKDRYTIRRLVSPRDEMRDLEPTQIAAALAGTIEEWSNTPEDRRRKKEKPTNASGKWIREVRSEKRGLLMLYPLDPLPVDSTGTFKPIIGMAISFPSSENAQEITYTVNNVFTANGDDDDDL